MNKGAILALVGVGAILAFGGARRVSNLRNFSDKLNLFASIPVVHKVNATSIVIRINGMRVMNQNDVDFNVTNLFTNVQFLNPETGRYSDIAVQSNTIPELLFGRNRQTTIPMVELTIPLNAYASIIDIIRGAANPELRVITRFQARGYQLPPLESFVNAKQFLGPIATVLQKARLAGLTQSNVVLEELSYVA